MPIVFLVALLAAAAQAPVAPPAPAQPEPTAESPGYTYNAEGRRDPFVSLIGRGTDDKAPASHTDGLPGLMVDDVTVKGVIRDRGGFMAMVQGSDKKSYMVRAGDRLMDGTVKSISADGVIFSQNVNDPLALVKQRDVQKRVRAGDGRG